MACFTVLGSTGGVGRVLVEYLLAAGDDVIAVGRDVSKLELYSSNVEKRVADFNDRDALSKVLYDAEYVVNCGEAYFTEAVIAALPNSVKRLVVVGSTRKFTKFPDEKARYVNEAERLLKKASVPFVMIHPTMIYGALGESNVQRIVSYIKKFHVVALPNRGSALLQPIYVKDVARCLRSACVEGGIEGKSIIVAGFKAISYREFVKMIAKIIEKRVCVVSLPVFIIRVLSYVTRIVPFVSNIKSAEVKRLLEDKDFKIDDMVELLDVKPVSVEDGLEEMLLKV